MLVMSRHRDQEIGFFLSNGTQIIITVINVRGCTVRLGVQAPDSVKVLRGELCEKLLVGTKLVLKDLGADNHGA